MKSIFETLTKLPPLGEKERVEAYENRLGCFRISRDLLRLSWKQFLPWMHDVLVVQVTSGWVGNYVEFLAYSPQFEIVDPGIVPPLYRAEFARVSGVTTFRFKKIEE